MDDGIKDVIRVVTLIAVICCWFLLMFQGCTTSDSQVDKWMDEDLYRGSVKEYYDE